jgi:hypothetical protein
MTVEEIRRTDLGRTFLNEATVLQARSNFL